MNQEKQLFLKTLSELQTRKKTTDRKKYGPLVEEAEALLQTYTANDGIAEIDQEALSELYFLTAELLFGNDLATRTATRSKTLANEEKTLEYYNKAIELLDKEDYSYGLWNFLSTAGHTDESIAALERFIERTGGTAKVLSLAAEYILMYADSEDTETIQKSVDYFYRAIEKEPDRYDTYWAFWTDLEEAVDVCPDLFKEALLCLNKVIELSIPETSKNHNTLGNRYFDLALLYIKMEEYSKAIEPAKKGLAVCEQSNYGKTLLAHCYHITNQPKLAAKYYLTFANAQDVVPSEYRSEYHLYLNRYEQNNKSLWGRLKKFVSSIFKR